ncbi:MAG: DUF3122 domain-containing protein [Symplocastrum torsivum CPER-KK1]|jgi:hypothetical protein|uniref:DUF3122 domain-containing protein n=1 Tax=Symplocastrum torsivum CPER-KK1 TaxID=450513 RepID=A0A951UBR8_9CYAN|nr:DUF3122 domain-containing protein [Symplocastrum torsivum CPER-KK1]
MLYRTQQLDQLDTNKPPAKTLSRLPLPPLSELVGNLRREDLVSQLLLLSGLVLLLLLGQFAFTQEQATAVLRQHQDEPGVMRYHSQQSLLDASGNAWQVVLFKQITPGQPIRFNLRLVGFPGIAELTHPQPLKISTASGQVLTAADVFGEESPAPNVGQYNFTEVLSKLQKSSLTLSVPLKSQEALCLKIPESLVTEWQWLETEL